jgi:hypothetical protein
MVVMVMALGWTAPGMAEGSGGASSWPWSGFTEGFVGWAESVWRLVASSEGQLPTGDEAKGDEPETVALDPDETTNFGSPDPKGEQFPALDPDG